MKHEAKPASISRLGSKRPSQVLHPPLVEESSYHRLPCSLIKFLPDEELGESRDEELGEAPDEEIGEALQLGLGAGQGAPRGTRGRLGAGRGAAARLVTLVKELREALGSAKHCKERQEFLSLVNKEIKPYNSMLEREYTEGAEEAKKAYTAAREESDDTTEVASEEKVSSALVDKVDAMLQELEGE
ncbi:hypothetical protein ZWY2020_023899 [Hordeum vulgare]|nr:hypothetical protein ZWY2020_023899 [Hordeum vulgare]